MKMTANAKVTGRPVQRAAARAKMRKPLRLFGGREFWSFRRWFLFMNMCPDNLPHGLLRVNGVVFPGATRNKDLYSKKIFKNVSAASIQPRRGRLYYYMKKILLLSAVLLGVVTVSQAGVRFSIGIPLPPPVVVTPPAPAYVQPPEVYVDPPPVYAPAPPVVVAPPVLEFGYGRPYYHPYRPYYRPAPYWHHDRDDHWRGHDWDHHRR